MTQNSVFCIAFSLLQADQMVQSLKGEGFSSHDIFVLSAAGHMATAWSDMTRGLSSQGVPLHNEGRVKEGRILISVQTGSHDEMTLVKEIFINAGGSDICSTEEPLQSNRQTITPHLTQRSEARLSVA